MMNLARGLADLGCGDLDCMSLADNLFGPHRESFLACEIVSKTPPLPVSTPMQIDRFAS
jgi:hypothetical protein